jgi:hypothetical protein
VLVAFAIFLVGRGGDRSVEQLERGLELRDERRRTGESHDVILGAAEVRGGIFLCGVEYGQPMKIARCTPRNYWINGSG